MIINHKSTAPTAGKSAHRPGGIHFHYLLTGKDEEKDNYMLALVETTDDYYTPRHRHNFEQVRLMVEGEFEYEPGHIQKTGSVGYFCEGVFYTQKGKGKSVALIMQLGGASGSGYMSQQRLREGADELSGKGTFVDGVYIWQDEDGKECKKDGYEATWEYVMGKQITYPRSRYERPIVFFPEHFNALPVRGVPGASIKELGCFNERGLRIMQLHLEPGAIYTVDSTRQSFVFYVLSGSGTVKSETWSAESAFQSERGEKVDVAAEETAELFVIGLPVFDD